MEALGPARCLCEALCQDIGVTSELKRQSGKNDVPVKPCTRVCGLILMQGFIETLCWCERFGPARCLCEALWQDVGLEFELTRQSGNNDVSVKPCTRA